MNLHQVEHDIFVTGQIRVSDLNALARNGIRTVVNNRPNHESFDQPTSDELAAAAAEIGLEYLYFPVLSGGITAANVTEFAKLRGGLEAPLLLFCRSGARSAKLWELSGGFSE